MGRKMTEFLAEYRLGQFFIIFKTELDVLTSAFNSRAKDLNFCQVFLKETQ